MSITVPEPVAQRGPKDARRHREKQREAIREKLPEIIAEESIITRAKGKTVKIPIRSIEIPSFRSGNRKKAGENGAGGASGGIGVGQGSGQPGDVIGRRQAKGPGQGGEAGGEPGEDYIESEMEIEELVAMMLEDLGLPNLEKKEATEIEVSMGFKINGINRSGPKVLMDSRRSSRIPFGRFYAFLQMLEDDTGRDQLTCFSPLKESNGEYGGAVELLEDPNYESSEDEVETFGIYTRNDLRYHQVREAVNPVSNAVIIAMMDVSGSMTTMKKYLARSVLFWLVEFLRTIYAKVEIRFIVHHANARLVPEEEFFHTTESGGTRCSSAYELATSLIDSQYPTNAWNVYAFHFSDGEDWETKESMQEARRLFSRGIRMFGYGEIRMNEFYRSYGNLLPAFKEAFHLTEHQVPAGDASVVTVAAGTAEFPFLGVVIEDRKHIWPALKEFLREERWS